MGSQQSHGNGTFGDQQLEGRPAGPLQPAKDRPARETGCGAEPQLRFEEKRRGEGRR